MAERSSVLISYRREDTAPWAGRLYDQLSNDLGRSNVFMDIDSIKPGIDFEKALQERMSTCDVCLPIIGRGWLDARLEGHRRLDDPADFVRREIEAAIARGARVIPVLVDGATVPEASALPDALKPLAAAEPVVLRHQAFRSDVNALLISLKRGGRGSLSSSAFGLALAAAFAVGTPIAVDQLGSMAADLFSFKGMDFAEGILGETIVFAVAILLGFVLMKVRGANLGAQERTLYGIGFVLLIATMIPEVFRVFVFAFTGQGLIHPSFLIGFSAAVLFMWAGAYVVFSRRRSELSHIELIASCAAAFAWAYLASSFVYVVLKQNYFPDGWSYDNDDLFQAALGAVITAVVLVIGLVTRRSKLPATV